MNRVFGGGASSKKKEAEGEGAAGENAPTLAKTAGQMDKRVTELDMRIQQCDDEILQYMKGTNRNAVSVSGTSSAMNKNRALQAMKRKKMLEAQRQQLMATQLNVEGMQLQHENMVMTANTVQAMQSSLEQMKKITAETTGALDPDKIADLFDDMQDMQMDVEEINEMMGRNYALDGVDDDELDAEFDKLEEEIRTEQMLGAQTATSHVPSYLPPDSTPAAASSNTTSTNANAPNTSSTAAGYPSGFEAPKKVEMDHGGSLYPRG